MRGLPFIRGLGGVLSVLESTPIRRIHVPWRAALGSVVLRGLSGLRLLDETLALRNGRCVSSVCWVHLACGALMMKSRFVRRPANDDLRRVAVPIPLWQTTIFHGRGYTATCCPRSSVG